MEPKLHRWVQRRGWDRAAACYERYWGAQLQPATELLLDRAALRPGEEVIDVACGTGLVTLPAARAVAPAGRVLAVDLAPKMVAAVVARARADGLTNVVAECRDAEDLGRRAEFDVALCSLGLMYAVAPDAAVGELHDVLRPGGRVAVSVWGARAKCGWSSIFPIVDARVESDVCPMFFALGAPDALAGVLGRAGFVDVETTRLAIDLEYATADDALGAAFLGGPVALAAARFGDDVRRAAHAEYLASIAHFADGAGGFRVPGEFVVATAHRRDGDRTAISTTTATATATTAITTPGGTPT